MGLDSALNIARSGLVAIQRNLDLVSQNIGNAKTKWLECRLEQQSTLTLRHATSHDAF